MALHPGVNIGWSGKSDLCKTAYHAARPASPNLYPHVMSRKGRRCLALLSPPPPVVNNKAMGTHAVGVERENGRQQAKQAKQAKQAMAEDSRCIIVGVHPPQSEKGS